MSETLESLDWHQFPRDGGQIVDIHYAANEYWLYRRSHDRSDGTITYTRAARDGSEEEGDDDFQPWNGSLPGTDGEWEPC